MLSDAFQKRIKRHVIAQPQEFFAAAAPGFEKLCFDELTALSIKNCNIVPGGVEFRAKLFEAYQANLYLFTANRILMRIKDFKAANFSELEKRTTAIPWELFLMPETLPQIHVSCTHCRLYHKKAVAERIQNAIGKRFKEINFSIKSGESAQNLFIRGVDDHFTLSLDSSGEHLHKRGLKTHGARAPLRETTAAAILKMAGYYPGEPLIDPMCGSGTFSLEAAMMSAHIPAGWFRDFAFMDWPSFKPQRWEYLRREAQKKFDLTPETSMIFASDQEISAYENLEKTVAQAGLSQIVRVLCQDFFKFGPKELTQQTGIIAINPPYGLRIGTPRQSRKLFYDILDHLYQNYSGWKLALIVPDIIKSDIIKKLSADLKTYPIWHGGLNLNLLTGKIT